MPSPVPILVILGWIINKPLTLFFSDFETIILFVSVILVSSLISDGRSNGLEGVMLMALYFVIALACASLFACSKCLRRRVLMAPASCLRNSLGLIKRDSNPRHCLIAQLDLAKNPKHGF